MSSDFEDRIEELKSKVSQLKNSLQTEEATKNALVMPFIKDILGYDVFNPLEVVPEFTADQGIKKGEKVDYAIIRDNAVQILIECKKAGEKLSSNHTSQLYRYFSVTDARIAILTNGIQYAFYTDLDAPNRMDKAPFMELDFASFNWRLVNELRKMSKPDFDLSDVVSAAGELKYTNRIKRLIAEEFSQPSDDLVAFFATKVYDGRMTQKVRDEFRDIVKRAAAQFVNDHINDRLKGAVKDDYAERPPAVESNEADAGAADQQVETTAEELQGFYIVRAILSDCIDMSRIVDRDTLSYFGVLLDDNNRKPICRLHFNRAKKYIGIFDQDKKETRHAIEGPSDIFAFKEELKRTIGFYEGEESNANVGIE